MLDVQNKNDNELVALIIENDNYFQYLIQRYQQKILRYILRLTNITVEEAEELLQEIFIKVYRNLHGFNSSLKFSSWLYRIAHNEVIDYWRKPINKLQTVSLEAQLDDDSDSDFSLLNILSDDKDLHQDQVKRELLEQIRETVFELPLEYKEVLVLKFLEEKSYAEISDILKKPEGTVATLINKAKKSFKQLAEKKGIEGYM